ncbi:MAG: DsrE family protein [Bacteroidales bacterium]|nr:DsrE family protein [Bacteroidales bacterium]
MKNHGFVLIILSLLLASCQPPVKEELEKSRDGVFIHITHDHNSPHRVLMPLSMATMMAGDKDVLIYMDIDAVKLVVKDAADIDYGHFTSLKSSLQKLIEMNVGIYACPSCMKTAGIVPEDLIEGVRVAEKDRFFDFTKGRIITLDY